MTDTKLTELQEWQRYWPLVLACSVGFSFNSVMSAAAGVFMEPLGKEFHWDRAMQSSGLSITAAGSFILAPLFGWLIDKIGTRRLALPGVVMSALCITGFGYANGSVMQWIVMWSVFALAAVAIKSTVWTVAVSGVFDKGRGMAIGVTLAGTAVAQTITPPLANFLIDQFGWRNAFAWFGLGWGGLSLVLCWFFLFDAADVCRKASGRPNDLAGRAAKQALLPGLTIPQAWRSLALWRIAISTFIMMFITIALNVHQFQILVESGVSRTASAWYASVAGIAGILGKLATGWLLDRYRVNWVGGLTLGSTAIAFLLLLMPHPSVAVIVTAMFINGYAAGTKLQIAGLLTSRYGGLRNFGAIYGTMAMLIAAGSGAGPYAAGLVYDAYSGYAPFLYLGIAGSLISGWLIFGMEAEPKWEGAAAPTSELAE